MSQTLADLAATELLSAFAAGQATPTEAVRSCLERIEETDADFDAVLTSTAEPPTSAPPRRMRAGPPEHHGRSTAFPTG